MSLTVGAAAVSSAFALLLAGQSSAQSPNDLHEEIRRLTAAVNKLSDEVSALKSSKPPVTVQLTTGCNQGGRTLGGVNQCVVDFCRYQGYNNGMMILPEGWVSSIGPSQPAGPDDIGKYRYRESITCFNGPDLPWYTPYPS
jgi:outer membrane murein-binding lipoprotein Lpp